MKQSKNEKLSTLHRSTDLNTILKWVSQTAARLTFTVNIYQFIDSCYREYYLTHTL